VDILIRIVSTIMMAAAVAMTPVAALAQISPGELSRAHADLEGMRNCLECHNLGEGPSDEKCLKCHGEIASGIAEHRGYHSHATERGKRRCFECHSEHAGRDFELIHWPGGRENFDHGQTGYVLVGRHSSLRCRDCHNAELIRRDLSKFGGHVHTNRTFLGLQTACLDCHADEHRGQLASDCTRCHSQDAWKPAPGFDHAKSAYPLTGRHLALSCAKCHPTVTRADPEHPDSEAYVRFTGLEYRNCTPCHEDVHLGNYGAQCASCHNTSGWHDIMAGMFDHSKTRFPLLGLHAALACQKCHEPGAKKSPLAHEKCADCHADVHEGQFASRPDRGACESCHSVDGFLPALFSTADHENTRFPLVGAHLAQPCFACHPKETSGDGREYRVYAVPDRRCESCHSDPHFGQFSASRRPKNCTGCHDMDGWTPVEFDHDVDSSYKLEGEHRRVSCGGCHVRVTSGGNTFIRYKPIDPSCKNCHADENLELSRGAYGQQTGAMN
jgi:hypothetical protein